MVVEEEIVRMELRRRALEQADRCMIEDIEWWLIDRPELIEGVVLYLRDVLECEGQRKTEPYLTWRSMK
jgi:hypothetical protein